MKVNALRDILEHMMYFIDLWVYQFRLEWNPLQICTMCRADIDVSCTFIGKINPIWLNSCLKWKICVRKNRYKSEERSKKFRAIPYEYFETK